MNGKLVEIELTELSKGNGTIEIKKTCPNCSHEMFFGVQNGKIAYTDSVVYWKSASKGQMVRCIICNAEYRLNVKDYL